MIGAEPCSLEGVSEKNIRYTQALNLYCGHRVLQVQFSNSVARAARIMHAKKNAQPKLLR